MGKIFFEKDSEGGLKDVLGCMKLISKRRRFTRCVLCVVEQTLLENDAGIEVPAVVVSCRRCDNCANSYGTDGPSIRRCFVLLRETCPNPNEHNWYADETSDDLDNWDTGRNAGYSTHCG